MILLKLDRVILSVGISVVLLSSIFISEILAKEKVSHSQTCGIENCHGLDISCGENVPEACTMLYSIGDNCRKYAKCEVIDGDCQLVKNEKFEECKECVTKCLKKYSDDIAQSFSCESQCMIE